MVNLLFLSSPRSLSAELHSSRSAPACTAAWGYSSPGTGPALALVELHEISLCPALQPVQVLLNGSTAFRCISYSSQFCVISKFAEGTLCPFIQVIDELVEQDWTEY